MIVTPLQYHIETKLVSKMDLLIKDVTKKNKDGLIIIEGGEGEGKTNTSIGLGYHLKVETGREVHMFFRLSKLVEFAQGSREQIIIWDEPALDSLSTDWFKETSKDLMRMLMTCRSKNHIFIFNFVKFFKFSEYIVVDRAKFLIHMYTRKGRQGRFCYVPKKKLQTLWNLYKDRKIRGYGTCKSFGGQITKVDKRIGEMGFWIEEVKDASYEDYERIKARSINEVLGKKPDKKEDKNYLALVKLRGMIANIDTDFIKAKDIATALGVHRNTLYKWAEKSKLIEQNTTPVVHIPAKHPKYNINGLGDGGDVFEQVD